MAVPDGVVSVIVEPVVHDALFPNEGNGYIRLVYVPTQYDKINNRFEEMTIRFSATNPNGLLWYNMDDDVRSYMYLEVMRPATLSLL